MGADVLKVMGQVAGIGGLALGVFLLLYRDLIYKNIFPKLPPAQAYRLLRLLAIAVWSLAIVGICAWGWVAKVQAGPDVTASDCGIAIGGGVSGGSNVSNNCPPKQQ